MRTGKPAPITCIGGAVLDRTLVCTHAFAPGTSNPVSGATSFGGVARNVCETLARLGARVRLISAVGEDAAGRELCAALTAAGADVSGVSATAGACTAEYTAAFWQGELVAGFADMDVLDCLTPEPVAPLLPPPEGAAIVVADCNLPAETLAMLAARGVAGDLRLAVDAVSLVKAQRLPARLDGLEVLFLNEAQARHMTQGASLADAVARLEERGARAMVVTRGAAGVLIAEDGRRSELPAPQVHIATVSGAGDALIAGTLLALSEGAALAQAVRSGLAAAALALQSMSTVPYDLTRARLDAELARQAFPARPAVPT